MTTTNTEDTVVISVRLPRETADRIREIAEREERQVSAEIRRLVRERVDGYAKKGPRR